MMKTLNILFKQLDSFIFQQIDNLKDNAIYQKVQDSVSALDQNAQKILGQALSIIVVILPFLIVITLFFMNLKLKNTNNVLDNIQMLIGDIDTKKSKIKNMTNSIVANFTVTEQNDLENRIKRSLKAQNMDPEKISLDYFSKEDVSSLSKVSAELKFKKFTNSDLSIFLLELLTKSKITISELTINRDAENKTIEGSLGFSQFIKSGNYNEE